MRRISVVFVLIIILTSIVSGFNTSSELYAREENDINYNIKLKSRTVVPDDGLNRDVINRLQKIPYNRIHVLLSLDHIPNTFERSQLEENGVKLLAYIPDNGWFASVPKDSLNLVVSLPLIRWLGEILPEDKLGMSVKSREFGDWSYNNESNSVKLIVQLFEDVSVERGDYYRIIESYGAEVLEKIPVINSILIEIPVSNIDSLSEEDLVQWIEEIPPPPENHLNDTREIIGVDIAHDPPYEFKGAGVTIAMFEVDIWCNANSTRCTLPSASVMGLPDASHLDFDRDEKIGLNYTMPDFGLTYDDAKKKLLEEYFKEPDGEYHKQMELVKLSETVESRIIYGEPNIIAEMYSSNATIPYYVFSNDTAILTKTHYGWLYWHASNHATHVAGIAIGEGEINSKYIGVAPNATMVAYRATGNITKLYDKYVNAVNNYDARISTNSWGGGPWPYATKTILYDKLVKYDLISIVASAGNYGSNATQSATSNRTLTGYMSLGSPNDGKNTITVGSIDTSYDMIEGEKHYYLWRSAFSSRGPSSDGRIKPDITAPGCRIDAPITNNPKSQTSEDIEKQIKYITTDTEIKKKYYSNTYTTTGQCGTSMSAPAVAGSLALMIEAYESRNSEPPLPSTLKAVLIHTAVDLDRSGNGEITFDGPDLHNGWGLINVADAIDLIMSDTDAEPKIIESTISYLEADNLNIEEIDTNKLMIKPINSHSYNIDVAKGTIELKVTLVWDDAPGVLNAAKALQNDLDVYIIDPNGNKHLPWILDVSNCDPNNLSGNDCYSKPATKGVDHVNNVEQVIINNSNGLQGGEWEIIVKGTIIPVPMQKYSLIITSKPSNIRNTVTYTTVSTESISEVTITQEETSTTISQISDPTITTIDIATLTPTPASQKSEGGGCLIATAAFGSELSPQIQFLRGFRDHKIMSTEAGANFMKVFNQFYYSFSPQIAEYERSNILFKNVIKYSIYPLLGILSISETGYNIAGSSELGAISSGFIAAMLIGVIYLSPFTLMFKFVRKNQTSSKTLMLLILNSLFTVSIGIMLNNPLILMITTSFFILTTIIGFSILTPKILVSVYKKYLMNGTRNTV